MKGSGRLADADLRLAKAAAPKVPKESGRKYPCVQCGLHYPVEDLIPDVDEEGKRVGFICDNCY